MAVAIGFRSLQVALRELYKENSPERGDIHILSGHGGPGFRDAFEYVTRNAYHVETSYPVAEYDPHRLKSYPKDISDTGNWLQNSLFEFVPLLNR
ncbi:MULTISPECIES: hypothetical protein [Bacillaceae]|uniref:Uncharacterized protein n=1 Tax=Domibacillus aminovorans TaxID=29332 RepID=A0A177KW40_9BACI|nr:MULTISPECIES: hypothetical protein [Bacillaceae]OAH57603.1 hypothetical protein AWH48_18850 [Domibacillus aminovorans]